MKPKSLLLIFLLWLLALALPSATLRAQEPATAPSVEELIAQMTAAQRVGQLFLVTFPGNDLSEGSVAARLVRDLRVGGVVLRASNGNYRNDEQTPSALVTLTNGLQALSLEGSREEPFVPLFVAISQSAPSATYADGLPQQGFTRLPSQMSLGATWRVDNAALLGQVLGQELQAVGINLLLGPDLDVVDPSDPVMQANLGTRTFGESPYWVGEMGRAFVRGVAVGGQGRVATVARHFPGMGSSDRPPDDEIATVQKPLVTLRQDDLLPFFAVTHAAPALTDTVEGLMTTNLRYRALQGNVRQTTRPLALDAQSLPALLAQPELQSWYQAGGIIVSDELGALALRRFYEQQAGTFPARTVARDAFTAGNDLLFVTDFALTDDWAARLANIEETIGFFAEQYESDPVFASEVDNSLRRLLTLKLALYGGDLAAALAPLPNPTTLDPSPLRTLESQNAVARIAQEAATLLHPAAVELAGILPAPPLSDETLVIVTDARTVQDCAECPERPVIGPQEFAESLLRRYGPGSSGQLSPDRITNLTFNQLEALLDEDPSAGAELQSLQATLEGADWLIFLVQSRDAVTDEDRLGRFLRTLTNQARGQKLMVFSFGTPYNLDATEISKVTAYYAFYTATPTFVDAAALLLFQGYSASGVPPVTIHALPYHLGSQLHPDPAQTVRLCNGDPALPDEACEPLPATLDLSTGNEIRLRTSVIVDHNGHPVPDGTPVHFILRYPNENIEQPRQRVQTVGGVARTTIVLDRQGQLAISVIADELPTFTSTTVQITIQGSAPPVVETVEPTPTFTPEPSPTPSPTITSVPRPTRRPTTPTPSPVPTPLPLTRFGQPNEDFGWWTFFGTLLGLVVVGSIGAASTPSGRILLVRRLLMTVLYGLGGYLVYLLLYAFRLLPPDFNGWGAIVFAIVGGLVALVREEREGR